MESNLLICSLNLYHAPPIGGVLHHTLLNNYHSPETDLLAGALLCAGARFLAVLGRDDVVVVPGVADILQTGDTSLIIPQYS
jgi:hypothetical protein